MNVSGSTSTPVQSTQQPTRSQTRQQTEVQSKPPEPTPPPKANAYQQPTPVVNTQGQTTGRMAMEYTSSRALPRAWVCHKVSVGRRLIWARHPVSPNSASMPKYARAACSRLILALWARSTRSSAGKMNSSAVRFCASAGATPALTSASRLLPVGVGRSRAANRPDGTQFAGSWLVARDQGWQVSAFGADTQHPA
jgi:hypothetical protein